MYTQKYYILKKIGEDKYYKGGFSRDVEEINAFLSSIETSFDTTKDKECAYKFKSIFKASLVKKYLGDTYILIKIVYNQNRKKETVYKQKKKYYILKSFTDNEFYKGDFNIEKHPINSFFKISETSYSTTKNEELAYKFKSFLLALMVKRYLKDLVLIKKEGTVINEV